MRSRWGILVLVCACNAQIGKEAEPDAPPVDADENGNVDAIGTFGPWSTPRLVPGLNTTANEDDASLSESGLELVFARQLATVDMNRKHLFYISRPSPMSSAWSAPVRLAFSPDGASDETPRFSDGDRTLYFASSRGGTNLDIYQVTRPTAGVPTGWDVPAVVPNVNSSVSDKWCMPCNGGRYVMVSTRAPSTNDDLYEGEAGMPPQLMDISSDTKADTGPLLSADCMTLYFASERTGVARMYKTTRTAVTAPWAEPELIEDFLSSVGGNQEDPFISADQRTFIFASTANATKDVFITTR